jgi:hypothetical protein
VLEDTNDDESNPAIYISQSPHSGSALPSRSKFPPFNGKDPCIKGELITKGGDLDIILFSNKLLYNGELQTQNYKAHMSNYRDDQCNINRLLKEISNEDWLFNDEYA